MGSYSELAYGLPLTDDFGGRLPHVPQALFDMGRAIVLDEIGGMEDLEDEDQERLAGLQVDQLPQVVREAIAWVWTAEDHALVLGFLVYPSSLTDPTVVPRLKDRLEEVIAAYPDAIKPLIQSVWDHEAPTFHTLSGRD